MNSVLGNIIKYTGLFLILVFVSGCSTKVSLADKPRLLHFSTPEASGGFGEGSIYFSSAVGEPEYIFGTLSTFNNPPNTITGFETSVDKQSLSLNLALSAGILKNLDFYVDSKAIFGLKYQLLGSPQSSKQEGMKLAVAAQFGTIFRSEHASSDAISDPVPNANSESKLNDISVNLGYRYNPNSLVYVNSFINKSNFSGELWLDGSGINRTVTASSKSFGILLGYQYTTDSGGFFVFESGVAKTIWDNRGSVTATPVGISWGRNW